MQTDTQKYNESIKPNSKEIEILKKYFPQCFSKPETDENGAVMKEHFEQRRSRYKKRRFYAELPREKLCPLSGKS